MGKLIYIPADPSKPLRFLEVPSYDEDPEGKQHFQLFRQAVGGNFQIVFLKKDNLCIYCNDTIRLTNYGEEEVNHRLNEFFNIAEQYQVLGDVILFQYSPSTGSEEEIPSNVISELISSYGEITE